MSVNFYLVLIIFLLLLLFLLAILLLLCKRPLEQCCSSCDRVRQRQESSENGHRNQAFENENHPALQQQRPFTLMEALETPPSYEEAVKQEFFRFNLSTTSQQQNATSPTNPSDERHLLSTSSHNTGLENLPSTSRGTSTSTNPTESSQVPSCRRSSSGSTSGSRSPTLNRVTNQQLSPITEEEENYPVTVIIDCIGVQAARLMDKCDTTVKLIDSDELTGQSRC